MKSESENNFFVESESEDGNPLLQCGLLIMRLDVQCQALLRLSAVWRWNERKCPRIIQIQTNEGRQETKQKTPMFYACTQIEKNNVGNMSE